jgi:hypothetical protein
LFHTKQKNPTNLAPTLDKTHDDAKNKSTIGLRDITLKRLGTPTTIKVYIQHIAKENSKIRKTTRTIHSNNSIKTLKMYPKEPEFLYKAAYTIYLYKKEGSTKVLQSLAVSFIIRRGS